jgi:hypothetical protein
LKITTHGNNLSSILLETGGLQENNTTSNFVEEIVSPRSEKKTLSEQFEVRDVTSTPQCQHIEGSRNPMAQICPYQIRVSFTKMGSKLNPVADPYTQ